MVVTKSNICYVTDEFRFDGSEEILKAKEGNTSEDKRVLWCTSLAAVSRGKEYSANPEARYRALLKEAAPLEDGGKGTPSRPLEFIPIVLDCVWRDDIGSVAIKLKDGDITYSNKTQFINRLGKFGFISSTNGNEFKIRTNMRAVLNFKIPYEKIPYNREDELKSFKAVRVRAPMFVFNHLITHTMLSKEARSERVVDYTKPQLNELYPEPFNRPFWKPEQISDELFDLYLNERSMVEIMNDLKEMGFKKEIYQRALLEWRYKDFVMVGWEDTLTWDHLFKERGADEDYSNWTQEETKITVKAIKEIVKS